jgi:mono/diheme cytochrome c family protein
MTGIVRRSSPAAHTLFILLFSFLAFLLAAGAAAQPDGKALFDANCKQCHTTTEQKLIGPGLKGIEQRRGMDWLIPWVKNSQAMIKAGDEYGVALFNQFNKVVMPSQALSDEEITAVFAYVKEEGAKADAAVAVAPGVPAAADEPKGSPWTLAFVFLVLLVLGIILQRVKKGLERAVLVREGKPLPAPLPAKKAAKRWIRGNKKLIAVAFLVLTAWGSYKGWYALAGIGIQQGYAPDQPIQFSHKVHAGQDKIDCKYCHSAAEKSKTAGIPPAGLCMNCHRYIQEGPLTGKEEIAKIYAALDFDPATGQYGPDQKPIQWVRVHNLPDLAYFNHSQHVAVAGLACQTCHGPVEEMDVVKQFSPLTMGWCIECHRTTEVNMEGNGYYDEFHKKLIEEKGPDAKITVEAIGGTECIRCHY